ncbi:hypothetical protein KIN20_024809 [Parelaphostrongylus tenuis]|uniref:Uncharacterized protein n=1 Tax=Parelaphostrongylus tenuis TaxID=148309 RepID=A0AAD5MXH2_PARTN|nr:hypothetical protein KIN20_024809 [Parelaphostrongylus tenuis]
MVAGTLFKASTKLGAKSGDSQCLDNCNLINAFQCLSSQVATLQNTQLPTEGAWRTTWKTNLTKVTARAPPRKPLTKYRTWNPAFNFFSQRSPLCFIMQQRRGLIPRACYKICA